MSLAAASSARRSFEIIRQPPVPGRPGTLAYAIRPCEAGEGAPMVGFCRATLNAAGDEAEIGFAILPEFRGRGYATESGRALVEHLFARAGVRRVIGGCFAGNVASERVYQKIGLRRNREDWFGRVARLLLRLPCDQEVWYYRDVA